MKQTILIVESPNDVAFYKKLHSLVINENEKHADLIDIVEFEDLHNFDYNGINQRGYSLSCLTAKLENIKRQLDKPNYQKVNHIAVIVDVDFPTSNKPNKEQDGGRENRLFQVSKAINTVFYTDINFEKVEEGNIIKSTITLDEDTVIDDFFFSCFLTKNANAEGNLDYLLMDLASKKEEAHHANCLFSWRDCLESKNKTIKDGYLIKLWIDYYIRFDTSNSKEKSDAEIKLKFPYVMENKGEEIFKFDSSILKSCKDYLSKILIR